MMLSAAMHKYAFRKHRERVHHAKCEVDHQSPALHVANLVRPYQLKTDASHMLRIIKNNTKMLRNINRIKRTIGVIDSFPREKRKLSLRGFQYYEVKRLHKLEQVNRVLGERILRQKSDLKTRQRPKRSIRHRRKTTPEPPFQLPTAIMSKYGDTMVWKLPRSVPQQRKLLRPRIYIQLAVKEIRPLGRLIIELYTEASPQMVLEFVRICSAQKMERLSFLRLFPGLWLEGELLADAHSLTYRQQEYDMRALDHASGAGILSYSTRYLKGFRRGFINYAISFKPLRVLNGRRVAFGRVLRGLRILDCIQDYGTKNGKPRKEIQVTGCGVMP